MSDARVDIFAADRCGWGSAGKVVKVECVVRVIWLS